MPEAKLTYFNTKGLGEGIRMLLAYGGQEFEDRRVSAEEWPKLKPTTPFGNIPIVEIDGKTRAQSLAIYRYLGRKYGLGGKNIDEDFEIDQSVDFFTDIRTHATLVHFELDKKLKASKHEALLKNYYPGALAKLDNIIKENNGHLALGRLTWADFIFAGMYDAFKVIMQMPDMDEKYPSFPKLRDTVVSIPKVKAFVDSAPETPACLD